MGRGGVEPPVPDFHGPGFDAVQVRAALIGNLRLFVRLEVWQQASLDNQSSLRNEGEVTPQAGSGRPTSRSPGLLKPDRSATAVTSDD